MTATWPPNRKRIAVLVAFYIRGPAAIRQYAMQYAAFMTYPPAWVAQLKITKSANA